MPGDDDALAGTLEHAADAAEDSALAQQRAAVAAREAARHHREGWPLEAPETGGAVRLVLDLLGSSAGRLAVAVGGVRRAWAAALAEDGLSIRQIGERLGVTHQRVSALLMRHRNGPGSTEPTPGGPQ